MSTEDNKALARRAYDVLNQGNLAATNKSCAIRGSTISELQGDKIRRNSDYWDMVTFLKQVGVMPSV